VYVPGAAPRTQTSQEQKPVKSATPNISQSMATLFGSYTQDSSSMEGTFYDFRHDSDGSTEIKEFNQKSDKAYTDFLTEFTRSDWTIPSRYKYYTSNTKLYTKMILLPTTKSPEAGRTFHSKTNPDGRWIAHYKGFFSAPETGSYRFLGWGDNVLMVRVGKRVALDASDVNNWSGERREKVGDIEFMDRGKRPLFGGDWISLQKGENKPIEVVVGDYGGVFSIALFIQKQGAEYKPGKYGTPLYPVFKLSDLTGGDKQKYQAFVPGRECLEGPSFGPVTDTAN